MTRKVIHRGAASDILSVIQREFPHSAVSAESLSGYPQKVINSSLKYLASQGKLTKVSYGVYALPKTKMNDDSRLYLLTGFLSAKIPELQKVEAARLVEAVKEFVRITQ